MKTVIHLALFFLMSLTITNLSLAQEGNKEWPVLKTYDQNHIQRISMPIGGIGTGTISLKGSGGLQDWEVMNRAAKGFNPSIHNPTIERQRTPFFAINVQQGVTSITRNLEGGPMGESDFVGIHGSGRANHGLPKFTNATFEAAYPFGKANLSDTKLPVDVIVKAFNPLIPGNVDDSSIPMMVLTYTVKNKTSEPMEVSISGNIQNFIGYDGAHGKAIQNRNQYREAGNVKGIYFTSEGVNKDSEQWGTMALVGLSEGEITYRTAWLKTTGWGNATLDFWKDFSEDGLLENRTNNGQDAPTATLAIKSKLAAGEEKDFQFLITWHFPNRKAWRSEETVGNYYTTQYEDAWQVAKQEAPRLPELESKTVEFVNSFVKCDIPEVIKEAALFNLANLRTQTAFRIKNGQLLGWEGTTRNGGTGYGSCTHVWNYEQTTAFLFGDLAKTMREVEFKYATDESGLMSFRINLPLEERAQEWGYPAADGQMGSIMQFYREWQLSGDDDFLREHWSKVKKTLEFCWIPNGWDADKDGVMEGSQHNTMDVEYFGPNPQMAFWYLGALKATEEMADYLGEKKFAKTCRTLYENGSNWIDVNLFNGEYYEHDIRPPLKKENVADKLTYIDRNWIDPLYQLGDGVLVDQLIGQVMSHFVGLGYLGNIDNIKKTHQSILKYNYRENMIEHLNVMRSFALPGESALLMAHYPNGRLESPFPYFSEVMTGFEYTAAIGMLYEGLIEDGLETIKNIRDRFDGRKRNPFNEIEYGNHYGRSMIAWGGVLAMTGFNYSAVNQSMKFNAQNGFYFWSNGYQYGTLEVNGSGTNKTVTLISKNGDLTLKTFMLNNYGIIKFRNGKAFKEGESADFKVNKRSGSE
jgi:non-lysosomal glucosylceramidase